MCQDVDQGDEVDLLLGRALLAGDSVDVEFGDDALVAQGRLPAQPATTRAVRRRIVAPSARQNQPILFIRNIQLTPLHLVVNEKCRRRHLGGGTADRGEWQRIKEAYAQR